MPLQDTKKSKSSFAGTSITKNGISKFFKKITPYDYDNTVFKMTNLDVIITKKCNIRVNTLFT